MLADRMVRTPALRVGMYAYNVGGEVIHIGRSGDTYFVTFRNRVSGHTFTLKASRARMWDVTTHQ